MRQAKQSPNTLQKTDAQTFQASFATETLSDIAVINGKY